MPATLKLTTGQYFKSLLCLKKKEKKNKIQNKIKKPTYLKTLTFHSKSFKNTKIKAALRTHTRISDRLPRSPRGTEDPRSRSPGAPLGVSPSRSLPLPPAPAGPPSGRAGDPGRGSFSGSCSLQVF